MSKIGENPIKVPASVTVEVRNDEVMIKGSGGEKIVRIPSVLKITKTADMLELSRINEDKKTKSSHGLYRQLIANYIVGMDTPWQKRLEVVGTGYTVKLEGENLVFKLGYSHPSIFKKVDGIRFQVEGNNKAIVSGWDKQLVGQIAYQIKLLKKPDSYKGKGIRYEGEQIRLKPGKKVKATTGAAGAA